MQRPSVVTFVLLAAALALAGNMATNTVHVPSTWWPYLIWTLVVALVVATVLVELRRVRDAVDVVRVSRLTDPIALGVHPAAVVDSSRVPPFVERDRLPDLENALRTGGFVLVVGDSTAGKTRLAYEAMRRVLPRHLCIRPRTPDALPAALALARRKKRAVLWLDDLERFLGFTDLPRCVVLATMRTHERDALSHRHDTERSAGERQSARSGRDVLNQVSVEIRLDRMWSAAELERAQASSDSRITQALAGASTHGIAELVASGPQLLQEWRDAGDVRGAAIVSAAVDVRLAGYHRPVPLTFLESLHTSYLPRGSRPGTWEAALGWATQPLHGTSSLLEPVEDGYVAFDYLVDATAGAPIPTTTWEALVAFAPPASLAEVAWQASLAGQFDQAEKAFTRARDASLWLDARHIAVSLGSAGLTDRAVALLEDLVRRADGVAPRDVVFYLRETLIWEIGEKITGEGDPEQALELARRHLADCTTVLGLDDPDTMAAQLTLARQVGSTSPGEALRLADEIRGRAPVALGTDHPVTLRARFEFAAWTHVVDGPEAAVPLFTALAQQLERNPNPDLEALIDTLWNLGGSLQDSGRVEDAVAVLTEAVDQSTLYWGPDHVRTVRIRRSLEAASTRPEA